MSIIIGNREIRLGEILDLAAERVPHAGALGVGAVRPRPSREGQAAGGAREVIIEIDAELLVGFAAFHAAPVPAGVA